ncbi:MAG: hypothetical protein Q9220_003707 [cf. Caloplaca sp. 1 TL-2023]
MASRHDLEDAFNAMRPHFEDKETEQNWQLREKDITKLRRITVGNAPTDLKDFYAIGIKSLLEGIIKVVNSLRTTLSANGCDLLQDMAKAKVSTLDSMAEIALPPLVKLCSSTKKIAAAKADATVGIIIAHISYSIFLMRLIWSACDDKNVQPRKFATGWLKILILKHRDNKSVFEKGEGLLLFEKCLKKGLGDMNPEVRKEMRPTYWAFIRLWPERSENILSALSEQHRKVLVNETADTASVPAPAKAATVAAAKNVVSKAKPSIKDAIAAKRQAAKAEKAVPERRISTSSSTARPAAAPRTLSSAPVRPSRMVRKPTATATKAPSPSFSKSAIEVSKPSTPEAAAAPAVEQAELKRPVSAGAIIEQIAPMTQPAILSPSVMPMSSPQRSPSKAFEVPARSRSSSNASSTTSSKAKQNPSPTRSSSKAFELPTHTRNSSKVSEAPTLTSIDRPMKPIFSRKEAMARRALEELPINKSIPYLNQNIKAGQQTNPVSPTKPIERVKPAFGVELHVGKKLPKCKCGRSHSPDETWKLIEKKSLSQSSPGPMDAVKNLRTRLCSHIDQLGVLTNVKIFRDIQTIIRNNSLVLSQDSDLFDKLLFKLFSIMDSYEFMHVPHNRSGTDSATQIIITLRILLRQHTDLFQFYYPRALCVLLAACKNQDDTEHVAIALQETIDDIISQCDDANLEDSIDSVLDYMESSNDSDYHQQLLDISLYTLTRLIQASDPVRACRPREQMDRLGKITARGLTHERSAMRLRAQELAVRYRVFLDDDDRFWGNVSSIGSDRLRLLTYYDSKEE